MLRPCRLNPRPVHGNIARRVIEVSVLGHHHNRHSKRFDRTRGLFRPPRDSTSTWIGYARGLARHSARGDLVVVPLLA